jgi:hypothetical protein
MLGDLLFDAILILLQNSEILVVKGLKTKRGKLILNKESKIAPTLVVGPTTI